MPYLSKDAKNVSPIRILCVDDEPAIQTTMAVIFRQHGYEVTAVGSVAEALGEIAAHPFDILVSDLNIGQQGDGFTVVSAMRRTHPECVNLILTGFPAIEEALRSISSQVDEVVVKPMNPREMVAAIEQRLRERTPAEAIRTRRLSSVLSEQKDEICKRIIVEMKSNPELAALPLSDEERLDHTRITLVELVQELEAEPTQSSPLPAAAKTGTERHFQQYPIALLAVNARLLQGVIYEIIHEQLLSIDLSNLMPDLKRLNEILSLQSEEILKKFIQAENRAS